LPSFGDSLPTLPGLLGALPVVLEVHSERGGEGLPLPIAVGELRRDRGERGD
jgi:hypothetical protein